MRRSAPSIGWLGLAHKIGLSDPREFGPGRRVGEGESLVGLGDLTDRVHKLVRPLAGRVAQQLAVADQSAVAVSVRARSEQLGDVPGPHLVRSGRTQPGLGVGRVDALAPAFADLVVRGQNEVHGSDRAQLPVLVEQLCVDLSRRQIDESLLVQRVEHGLPILGRERSCRAPAPPGSDEVTVPLAIEGRPRQADRVAGQRDAELGRGLIDERDHGVSSFWRSPNNAATFFGVQPRPRLVLDEHAPWRAASRARGSADHEGRPSWFSGRAFSA